MFFPDKRKQSISDKRTNSCTEVEKKNHYEFLLAPELKVQGVQMKD